MSHVRDGTELDRSPRADGDEPEAVTADAHIHLRVSEARCAETTWQLVGMHRQEHVANVHIAAAWRVHAVGADQDAPWPQHAAELAEHPVLHRNGRDVVQHGEACDCGEPTAAERERGSVGLHDLDARVREASPQRGCQLLVQLDRHDSWDSLPEGIGHQTRTGTHLEHLLAELATINHPWQQHVLHELGPLGARADLQVLRVHLNSVARRELPVRRGGGTTRWLVAGAAQGLRANLHARGCD
jgi:hypothetical protein